MSYEKCLELAGAEVLASTSSWVGEGTSYMILFLHQGQVRWDVGSYYSCDCCAIDPFKEHDHVGPDGVKHTIENMVDGCTKCEQSKEVFTHFGNTGLKYAIDHEQMLVQAAEEYAEDPDVLAFVMAQTAVVEMYKNGGVA